MSINQTDASSVDGWIIGWLRRNGHVPNMDIGTLRPVNFLTAGWIDSFSMVELIADIQRHYGIELDASHFERPDFATIGGLADLLSQLTKGLAR